MYTSGSVYVSEFMKKTLAQIQQEQPPVLHCGRCNRSHFLADLQAINWVSHKRMSGPSHLLYVDVYAYKCFQCKQWTYVVHCPEIEDDHQKAVLFAMINDRLGKQVPDGLSASILLMITEVLDVMEQVYFKLV